MGPGKVAGEVKVGTGRDVHDADDVGANSGISLRRRAHHLLPKERLPHWLVEGVDRLAVWHLQSDSANGGGHREAGARRLADRPPTTLA